MQKNTGAGGRNLNIEIWRIIFCLVIVLYHIGMVFEKNLLGAGYLCVEFYFILSGYGVYRAYQKIEMTRKSGAFFSYAGRRLLRLYPMYLCAMALMLAVRLLTGEIPPDGVWAYLKDCRAEFVMLQCSPLGGSVMVLTDWYVATLFWGSLLIMLLLLVGGRVTSLAICPVASILLYGYFARLIAKIDVIASYYGFLRALAGLGLGVFLGAVTQLWTGRKQDNDNGNGKAGYVIAAATANLILAGVTVYFQFGVRSLWDFAVIALFFVALMLLVSTGRNTSGRMPAAVGDLSRLTYPVYLFHLPILEMIAGFLG